jgi:hypothetical protein
MFIVTQFNQLTHQFRSIIRRNGLNHRPNLCQLANIRFKLPDFVQESPAAMRFLHLLSPLDWDHFPERRLDETRGTPPVPYAPFVAACLVKLDQGLMYMSSLRNFLLDHPALIWLLGFPLVPSSRYPWRFDAGSSLPTHRHFTRMLRDMPNSVLQFLLADSVSLLQLELSDLQPPFGHTISLDTKHIIAWVKENNHKAYVSGRYNKDKQPKGDPDCRLGCKRSHNQGTPPPDNHATPLTNPVPANTVTIGEYYWGYASGVVATKIPDWGEFVLAELTQPFDRSDVSYFFPLMQATELRLGFRPLYGAFDAAFDAFYVYDFFYREGQDGFAAVPFSEKGGTKSRLFDPNGLPICAAGLPMPLKFTFTDRTRTLIEHQRGKHVCPLCFPEPQADRCPVDHKRFPKGGCTADLPTSIGARLRYQLDRDSQAYKKVYNQRSATERVNSQAVALGIERPKIRNGRAIANYNTLIYILINLRALHRVRSMKADLL